MNENVEVPVDGQEQKPVAQENVSEKADQSLSQQSPQDADLLSTVELLRSEIRGLQGKQDKLNTKFSSQFAATAEELGVQLTPEQTMELRLRKLESGNTSVEDVSPASEAPSPIVDKVEALKLTGFDPANPGKEAFDLVNGFTGTQAELQNSLLVMASASQTTKSPSPGAVTAPTGTVPSAASISTDEAAAELMSIQDKGRSERTPQDVERVKQLMEQLEAEDK